jgi:hypothetical protein
MVTFFELATLEGWPNILLKIIDSQGEDMGPIEDNRPYASIVFIVFIFIQTFFVMNLFVSVIVDKFNEEIKRRQGSDGFTESQKEWVKIQRIMLHANVKKMPLPPKESRFRSAMFKLVMSNTFEYFVIFAIMVNTLALCLDYSNVSEKLSRALNATNIVCLIFFTVEAILKLTGFGPRFYFSDSWNRFDFSILILSAITAK